MTERLYRHPTDRVIAGVAGGLGTWLNIDPSLVRIAWVLLAIFSGGVFVLVYLVMMIVVPLPPAGWIPRPREWNGGGWNAYGGWNAPGSGWAPGGGPGDPPSSDPSAAGWPPAGPGAPGNGAPAGGPGTTPPGGYAWSTPPGGWQAAPQQPWSPPKPGNAGLIAGIVLVALGVWFLVDQYVRIDWDIAWPVVIMLVGGALIGGAMMRDRRG